MTYDYGLLSMNSALLSGYTSLFVGQLGFPGTAPSMDPRFRESPVPPVAGPS